MAQPMAARNRFPVRATLSNWRGTTVFRACDGEDRFIRHGE
ncbi:hypothetical protein TERTU_3446 [Teredinibacter turnerae T7901]|uniref:Uncharacterized protein n=1 Tax=Teredinibacter turnerae (strain ATCC 39867 / T7901) TaxID=377629 RepID=C5BQU6_TERTT|nr:hypothetical protein TERTU_3446 [Teredinibacter turnerae T7901]